MIAIINIVAAALVAVTAIGQTVPPPPELSEKDQATLKKCLAMTSQQQAQSSKCSAVMVKAGKADPAKDRGPTTSTGPR